MKPKTALLVALGVAVGLPYVTVLLLRSGRLGFVGFSALFVAVCLLVVASDLWGGQDAPAEHD